MKRNYHSYKAFIDLFMNMLAGFAMLLVIAFILVNPKVEESKDIESKAEIVITVSWPRNSHDDVDTYVEDPVGHLVFFQRREDGLMHLDRDDQGYLTDRIQVEPNVWIDYKENREIVIIRGLAPGEYVVNVHMYKKREKQPTSVDVTLEKMNPRLRLVAAKTLILFQDGDEKTAFRFTVTKSGDIEDVNNLAKLIASKNFNHPYRPDPDLQDFDPYVPEEDYDITPEDYYDEVPSPPVPDND